MLALRAGSDHRQGRPGPHPMLPSNREIRVGLVGAGHVAAAHLRAWRRAAGARVEAVFDADRGRAEEVARRWRLPRVHADLESLLEDADVVDVCTPPHTHAAIAARAIRAGRHLLIEKPVVVRAAEWTELAGLLEGGRSKLAVVHNIKFARCVARAKRWIEEGRIGRVLRVVRYFLTSPRDDRMLTGDRHWSHDLPGGRWFETLPHDLYLIHHFVGPLPVAAVSALRTGTVPGISADEVIVTFGDDRCLAAVHYSANCLLNHRSLEIFGTHGAILVDLLADAATLTRRRDGRGARALGGVFLDSGATLLRWLPDRVGYLAARLRRHSPHARAVEAFTRYLRGVGPSPTPLDEIDFVVRNSETIGREIDRRAREATN